MLVLNITNTTFVTGSFGFLSAGVGWFDDARLDTACEGGSQCVGASDGVVCGMGCNVGYYPYSGSLVRTCQANGSWTGGDLVCALNPPYFPNQSLTIAEVRDFAAFLQRFRNARLSCACGCSLDSFRTLVLMRKLGHRCTPVMKAKMSPCCFTSSGEMTRECSNWESATDKFASYTLVSTTTSVTLTC